MQRLLRQGLTPLPPSPRRRMSSISTDHTEKTSYVPVPRTESKAEARFVQYYLVCTFIQCTLKCLGLSR